MKNLQIAVVDDDETICAVVAAVIHEAIPNAAVTGYPSAAAFLHVLHTTDLLITDCFMPEMDGPTLIKVIKDDQNPMSIIMISGSDTARALGERAGIDRFVPKLSICKELAAAIRSLLKVTIGLPHQLPVVF